MADNNKMLMFIMALILVGAAFYLTDPTDVYKTTTIVAPASITDDRTWEEGNVYLVSSDLMIDGSLEIVGSHVVISQGAHIEVNGELIVRSGATFGAEDTGVPGVDQSDWGDGILFNAGAKGSITDADISQQTTCIKIEGGAETEVYIGDSVLYECEKNIEIRYTDYGDDTIITVMSNEIMGSSSASSSCISLDESTNDINFVDNTIEGCNKAVSLGDFHPSGTTNLNFFYNRFINNVQEVSGGVGWGTVTFSVVDDIDVEDDGEIITILEAPMGNYWSKNGLTEIEGSDTNGDGFIDTTYIISTGGCGDQAIDIAPMHTPNINKPPAVYFSITSSVTSTNIGITYVLKDDTIVFSAIFIDGETSGISGATIIQDVVSIKWDWEGDGVWDDYELVAQSQGIPHIYHHIYTSTRNFNPTAEVTDDSGQVSNTQTVGLGSRPIVVVDGGPTAVIKQVTTPINGLGPVELDGSLSTSDNDGDSDPADNNILEYAWILTDEDSNIVTSSEAVFDFRAPHYGEYRVTLFVRDEFDITDTTQPIFIEFIDTEPSAKIGITTSITPSDEPRRSYTAIVGSTITFSSLSIDAEDNIELYEWDFGDGTNLSYGEVVTHQFGTGDYVVSLSVEDESGNTDTETLALVIKTEKEDRAATTLSEIFLGPVLIGVIIAAITLFGLLKLYPEQFAGFTIYTVVVVAGIIVGFILIDTYFVPIRLGV